MTQRGGLSSGWGSMPAAAATATGHRRRSSDLSQGGRACSRVLWMNSAKQPSGVRGKVAQGGMDIPQDHPTDCDIKAHQTSCFDTMALSHAFHATSQITWLRFSHAGTPNAGADHDDDDGNNLQPMEKILEELNTSFAYVSEFLKKVCG